MTEYIVDGVPMKALNMRIPSADHQRLKERSMRNYTSMTQLVIGYIERGLAEDEAAEEAAEQEMKEQTNE